LDNANSFLFIAPIICEKLNVRVIAFDWPGHGKSSHSTTGYYDRSMYGVTLIRFMYRLQIFHCHFMAHSLGASFLPYIVSLIQNQKTKLFDIKSVIYFDQFGIVNPNVRLKESDITSLLPSKEEAIDEQMQEEIGGDQQTNSNRRLPKLYDSIDEIVRSRVWITNKVFPGNQSITEKSARIILERNVGKVTVVESSIRKKK